MTGEEIHKNHTDYYYYYFYKNYFYYDDVVLHLHHLLKLVCVELGGGPEVFAVLRHNVEVVARQVNLQCW